MLLKEQSPQDNFPPNGTVFLILKVEFYVFEYSSIVPILTQMCYN